MSNRISGFSIRGVPGLIGLAAVLAGGLLLGGLLFGGGGNTPATDSMTSASAESAQMWTCSMHPQIKLPNPGQCPICSMDLIPVDMGSTDEELTPRQLRMSHAAKELARIQTTAATRGFAEMDVRMYGKIAYDETKLAYITAWVPGRLDRLYADYTGVTVKKGDHLVDMYSPELVAAQEELIQAKAAVSALDASKSTVLQSTAGATLEAAREKLRLYGLTAAQIEQIGSKKKSSDLLTIYAPAGGVVVHKDAKEGMYVTTGTRIYTIADLQKLWVLFEAYESDLPWLHFGQTIEFRTQSIPGETFTGVISFIDPLVDPKTRTVRVRAVVENLTGRLKPDMFVRGTLNSRIDAEGHVIDIQLAGKWICPMHPEVVADKRGTCNECGMDLVSASSLGYVAVAQADGEAPILIPTTAPLITGKRAVVYVEVPNDDGPLFEGREVELGPRAGNFYVVKSGIAEGEWVVTNGAFKIDSELQIRAQPSMMSPGGEREDPHGGAATDDDKGAVSRLEERAAVADALVPVYASYFDVQMALANDDLEHSAKTAGTLGEAVNSVDMAVFSSAGHKRWMKYMQSISKEASRIVKTKDIADARDAFYYLSQTMIDVRASFGHSGKDTVYLTYCPMARDYEGAHWLQTVDKIWNPYWGAKMLRCGSVAESFAPAKSE